MHTVKSTVRLARPGVRLAVALGLSLGLLSMPGGTAARAEVAYKIDPAKVQGPDACGECHKSSVSAWKQSKHFKTFKALPRLKTAKAISKKMGLKRIKAKSDCLTCHFTSAIVRNKTKPIAGITCESCHGAGKDWIKGHADFGGKGVTAETESPDHRKQRYAQAESAGMTRPSRLYALAANCYGCHSVPNEKLVNVGGHAAGSMFELVSWSQGEVRHNVWYSKENTQASGERRRMMYIVGQALDLEFALRGMAKATTEAVYAASMEKRAAAALAAMKKIAAVVEAPEIKDIVAAGEAELKINNAGPLTATAERVGAAARKFAEGHDGSAFAAVDGLIPLPDKYKGKPAP